MNKQQRGFTVIELLVLVAFLALASIIFYVQRSNLVIAARDNERKTAINAMYYDLENVFYAKNGYYPSSISSSNLVAVEPSLFTDPNGHALGTPQSDYRYDATNCDTDNHCKSYTLRATLEHEATYIKTSKHTS